MQLKRSVTVAEPPVLEAEPPVAVDDRSTIVDRRVLGRQERLEPPQRHIAGSGLGREETERVERVRDLAEGDEGDEGIGRREALAEDERVARKGDGTHLHRSAIASARHAR